MFPAEYVKWQKTVSFVISMVESSNLIPMNRIIGCIKIQNDLFGRFFKGFNENFNESLAHIPTHLFIGKIFEPAKGRATGQVFIFADSSLYGGVLSQGVMIV